MAPVAAACSRNSSGPRNSATQSIASPGPAMKPSSDIALFTTTLPFAMLVSLILFLTEPAYADAVTTGDTGLPLCRQSQDRPPCFCSLAWTLLLSQGDGDKFSVEAAG